MVTIPTEEYKKLPETFLRVEIFADYVSNEEYSISRKDCGRFIGFKVENKED